MSRIINPDSAGKERQLMVRSVVLAVRELAAKREADQESRDLAAYIATALTQVFETVEISVKAWEKRGYWLKADRFRLEWEWTQNTGLKISTALRNNDWDTVMALVIDVAQKLSHIKVPLRNRIGKPWIGAWGKIK